MNDLIKIEIDVAIYSNFKASKAEMRVDRKEWNNASESEKAIMVNEFLLSEVLTVNFKELV